EKTELNSTRASSDIAWRDPFNPEFGFLIARANATEAIPQEPDRDRAVDVVSDIPSAFEETTAPEASRDPLRSEVKGESESAATNSPESPAGAEPVPTEKPEPRPAHISVAE